MKYRVRSTNDLLGYVRANSAHEAWAKAKAKWGMLVSTVEAM
jgi:hypothetical protein